jgi:hypothetical protein
MATYVYDDYRVTLTARPDGRYDGRAVGPDGVAHGGVFRLPLAEDEFEQAVLGVARTGAHAARSTSSATRDVGGSGPPAVDAERLGGALADALLAGDIAAGYDDARRTAASNGHGLRLTLSLADAPGLLSVPWELLYRRPRFFANQRQTPLVRHLETPRLPQPPAIQGTVRMLGVVASPSDCAPLDVAAERARVEQAVAKVVALGRVELDWLEPATPRRLREALRDGSYHVLHYVGHSDFTPDGDGMLFLEGPDGTHAEVDSTELANLLADQTSLRLVVLNSCEGARTTLTDPYAGVATTLVQLGVPAVVAMQFEISDAAAILFADELYTNLIGRQDPIDAAVAEARKAIYIELGTIEWATPVQFMGDVDVELFHFEVPAAPLPPPPPPSPPAPIAVLTEVVDVSARRGRRSVVPKIILGVVAVLALPFVVAFFWGAIKGMLETGEGGETPPAVTTPLTDPRASSSTVEPTIPPPPPLAALVAFDGTIAEPDATAEHPVTLTAGQVVYIAGLGECASTVDYHLATPSGSQLGGSPYVCDDVGRVVAPETGTYRLVVESFSGGTGPYHIEMTPVPADVTVPIVPGQPVSGEITRSGEHHQYTFAAPAGDVVYLRGDGPCGGGAVYRLLTPSAGQLGGVPYVCDDIGRQVLPESGTYTMQVESYDGGIGVYDLVVVPVPADVTTPIAVGDRVSGTITTPGEQHRYTFPAAARSFLELDGFEPCSTSVVYRLLTPSGTQVGGRPYACSDLGRQELPETGEYTLVVESYGAGAGTYQIQVRGG